MEGENEIRNYIKVWLQVIPSLCYCFLIGKLLPHHHHSHKSSFLIIIIRLLVILPIVCLFLYLPLLLHSLHLGGTFAFFIAWLANFKLLLFAFCKGPLSDPSLSLKQFVALASFPIKIHENPSPYSVTNGQNRENPIEKFTNGTTPSQSSTINGHSRIQNNGKSQNGTTPSRDSLTNGNSKSLNSNPHKEDKNKSLLNHTIKIVILAVVVRSYEYSENFHPKLLLVLFTLHIYILLEMILVMVAAMARTLVGIELEPQFNEPYLSSSLQDFWGRRWNMMVSKILRPTVYKPTYNWAFYLMGPKWASLPAVFITFLVSGFMHELIFYYLGRVRPTWEITWFFVLHGFCLTMEVGLKKKVTGKIRLPRVMSCPMTVGFVMVTAFWLFFPQILRCNGYERALQEYAAVSAWVKNVSGSFKFNSSVS